MHTIYAAASKVTIWLGPAGDNSNLIIDLLSELGKKACELGLPEIGEGGRRAWPKSSKDERILHLKKIFNASLKETAPLVLIDAFNALAERKWWKRVWVVQELAVARDPIFAIGEKRVPFKYLDAGVGFWTSNATEIVKQEAYTGEAWMKAASPEAVKSWGSWGGTKSHTILSMFRYRRWYQGETLSKDPSFYQLLLKAHARSNSDFTLWATDERDHIFGLLGLLDDKEKLGILPDYSKEWPDIYTDVAKKLIEKGHVDALALCQNPEFNSNASMPSWVPDWRDIREPFVADGATLTKPFSASGQYHFPTTPTTAETTITLPGVFVDKITSTGDTYIIDSTPGLDVLGIAATVFATISSFCTTSSKLYNPIYESPQQRKEAFWRIPIADLESIPGKTLDPTIAGPQRATRASFERYKKMQHLIKGYATLQDLNKEFGSSAAGGREGHVPRLGWLGKIVFYMGYFKCFYFLGRFFLSRAKWGEKFMWWMRSKFRVASAWVSGGKKSMVVLREDLEKEWEDMMSEQPELYLTTMGTTYARKPFMTSKGYVGLGPAHLQEGDVVCILFRGTVPFILRPHPGEGGSYRAVGEAYIHGIMDGEFMNANPKEDQFTLH